MLKLNVPVDVHFLLGPVRALGADEPRLDPALVPQVLVQVPIVLVPVPAPAARVGPLDTCKRAKSNLDVDG